MADFNWDGKLDMAVASPFVVNIYSGGGDGTFFLSAALPGIAASGVVAGDFNRDGNIDLAVPTLWNGTTIYLGNGDGTFRKGASIPDLSAGCPPESGVGP